MRELCSDTIDVLLNSVEGAIAGKDHVWVAERAGLTLDFPIQNAGPDGLIVQETIAVTELRHRFLRHHEVVLKSSLATVSRYGAATAYPERFA